MNTNWMQRQTKTMSVSEHELSIPQSEDVSAMGTTAQSVRVSSLLVKYPEAVSRLLLNPAVRKEPELYPELVSFLELVVTSLDTMDKVAEGMYVCVALIDITELRRVPDTKLYLKTVIEEGLKKVARGGKLTVFMAGNTSGITADDLSSLKQVAEQLIPDFITRRVECVVKSTVVEDVTNIDLIITVTQECRPFL